MSLTVKHASLTGAAANTHALVDGPKWDAAHAVTGTVSAGDYGLAASAVTDATLASNISYVATGSGGVAVTVASWMDKILLATSRGIVGDNATDNSTAIATAVAYCVANSRTLAFPDGIYRHSGTLNWAYNNLHVIALGENVVFLHTGTGIAHNFSGIANYPASQGCSGGVFGGPGRITLKGKSSGGTTRVVNIDNWHNGFMKVSLKDGETCLYGDDTGIVGSSCVGTIFDHLEIADHTVTPTKAIYFTKPYHCSFKEIRVSGCGAQTAIQFNAAVGIKFYTPVVESNAAGGLYFDSTCDGISLFGLAAEDNGTAQDLYFLGSNSLILKGGCTGTTLGSLIAGSNNVVQGTNFQSLVISAGAVGTYLLKPVLTTAFTDNGTNTTILGASGGLSIADKVPFAGTVSNTRSLNSDVEFLALNTSAGVSARAGFHASNNLANAVFGIGGTGFTDRPLLTNRAFIEIGAAGGGLVLSALGANPVIFAVNNTEAGRFSSTGTEFTLVGTLNNVRITPAASAATLTVGSGKTVTINNTLTWSGTDGTTMTLPTTSASLARTDAGQTFTGTQVFSSTITGSISGNAATVTTNANLTGPITSVGNATSIASQTGAGTKFVMDTAPAIAGGSHTALTSLGIRSTGAAFDLTLACTEVLTAGRTLTVKVNDAARTVDIAGNVTLAGALTTSGAFGSTFTMTGTTTVTFPTSGTLATLAGSEEFTNKTLNASVGKGTWTASGTWTLPAHTLGGTISGGGNQINNVIIGASTPLAGAFTTVSASGLITATGGQIAFPATQAASSDANTLDDYEEGTWTPVLTFATPGDLVRTYALQNAYYTKTGRVVTVNYVIQTASFTFTTASGTLQVTGLPFASVNDANARFAGTASYGGITKAGYAAAVSYLLGNSSTILIVMSGSGVAAASVTAADTPTGGTVFIAGTLTYNV